MIPLKPYKSLEHTADIRLKIFGKSFPELLKNAVFALSDQMVDVARVCPKRRQKFHIDGAEKDLLLFGLLKECLFLFDARRFVVHDLQELTVTKTGLNGFLAGETFSPRHGAKTEVKAVTLHGLKVTNRGGRWSAEVVLDI